MGTCLRSWPFPWHGKWAAVFWRGLENTHKMLSLFSDKMLVWCLCSLLPPIENSVKRGKGMEAPKAGLAAPTRQGKRVQVCDMDVGSCPPSLQGGC